MRLMKESATLDLIKGSFTPEDAKEILIDILNSKIHFHTMKIFSSRERFGKTEPVSERKIEYLNEARQTIQAIISEAIAKKKNIVIDAVIELNLEQEE